MLVLSDKQVIQKFFPTHGICWSEFGLGAASNARLWGERAGVYAFTTYPGRMRSNTETWGEDQVPTTGAGYTIEQIEGLVYQNAIVTGEVPTVLYVGRSESRSIADRLGDYLRGRERNRKPHLDYLLTNHPDRVYVRWTEAFHWETSLINRYQPEYNTRQTTAEIEVGSASFNWEGRITWYQCIRGISAVPAVAGIYAFTTPRANQMLHAGHIWYIGEAGNLRARMKQYIDKSNAMRGKQNPPGFVADILAGYHPSKVYVRWARNLIFENEVIRILKPVFNTRSTSYEWDED